MNAINHAESVGGQGMTLLQQTIVNEEIGHATGAVWSKVWQPPLCLRDGTDEQIERYLVPACRGDIKIAYLITEPGAGSDASAVQTTAVKRGDKYVINGEKWFATAAAQAQSVLRHVHVDGDPAKATVFFVDPRAKGFNINREPAFMQHTVSTHAEIELTDLEVDSADMLGEVGQGFDLTKDWFVETRVAIAARCVGMAERATVIANQYASERVQFGKPIRDFQAIEFMLADMAVEIMAAKSLMYRVAAEIDEGVDRKVAHAKVSAAKLFCSETGGRVVDRALQILGGRGCLRENPVERLYRDIRVERIWEGTSEIQRVIIGGQIRKRGLEVYTGWG